MSIEKDWETITRLALDPDHTSCFGRCVVDLHDRLAAVEKRLAEAQTTDTKQPDPSEWVGDLVMGWDATTQKQIGPEVYTGLFHGYHWLLGTCGPVDSVRPATDEERIRYKGEPPTVNGELCLVRDNQEPEDWYKKPWRFIGTHPVSGAFIMCPVGGNENWSAPWKYARKLTPFELKQHQAGEGSK